jgi:hypothetical protein
MKQVAMNSLLDNDVERPMTTQYPMTELVRTYLQQTGNKFFSPGVDPREEAREARVRRTQDLWDYLGDFA